MALLVRPILSSRYWVSGPHLHLVLRSFMYDSYRMILPAGGGGADVPRQARVVEVYQLPGTYTLRQLTRKIHDGPATQFSTRDGRGSNTKWAMIAFMEAEDAKSFILKNEAIQAEMGENQSWYGPGVNVVWGNPYPEPGGGE